MSGSLINHAYCCFWCSERNRMHVFGMFKMQAEENNRPTSCPNNGLTEIAGLDIDGRVKKRGWTLQDWTVTDEFAGVDIAGLDIDGLDNGGPDIDGLDIAGLDIDGRLWAIDYNILTQEDI